MPLVADHDDFSVLCTLFRHFDMHLCDERTRRIIYAESARLGFSAHGLRDSVSAENDRSAGRYLVKLLDENGPFRLEILDDVRVVHDLVPDVNGRTVLTQSAFDDLDCAVYASTETTRFSEQYLHWSP